MLADLKKRKESGELQKLTLRFLLKQYKSDFSELFSNKPAVLMIAACFIRLLYTKINDFFLANYMKVYSNDYEKFAEYAFVLTGIAAPTSVFITGFLIDYFGKKTIMAASLVTMTTALITIPTTMIVYY